MNKAFSLVELSIVLVILGLLTGGILAGQSLIRAAELRAVSTEYNRWITAVHAFRDKYMGLPGDMANATKFWGALDGNDGYGADCRGENTATGTCNGNGDGRIIGYDVTINTSQTFETYLFWNHLSRAGLIEGSYSGSTASGSATACMNASYGSVPGCNVATSKLGTQGMWQILHNGILTGDNNLFDGSYGNSLFLTVGPGWQNPIGGLLKIEELWNIDTKMDDGKPGTGKLVASRWNQCTEGAASTADYNIATYMLNPPSYATGNRCIPVFRNVF